MQIEYRVCGLCMIAPSLDTYLGDISLIFIGDMYVRQQCQLLLSTVSREEFIDAGEDHGVP